MGHRNRVVACLAVLSLVATTVQAREGLFAAIQEGQVNLDLRYRFEYVDQEGFDRDAEASTLRTRLGYRSADLHGFAGHVEFSDTRAVGFDNYQDADTPVVADPEVTELNRAYLEYGALTDTTARLGRQRIILDNVRWIGNVGWRQQEQTFDAISLETPVWPDLTATYAYLWQRNMITGSTQDQDSHLLNLSYAGLPWGELTAYGYWLDFERDAPTLSSRTLGLRFSGSREIGASMTLDYTLEYANQQDAFDNPDDRDFDYALAELGVTAHEITLKGGYEMLEGDGDRALQTPLATLHAQNGWADQFLTIPDDGLVDRRIAVSASPLSDVTLVGVYHDYEAERGGTSYANEINLSANWQLNPELSLGAKFADYQADELSVDTRKAWAYMSFSF